MSPCQKATMAKILPPQNIPGQGLEHAGPQICRLPSDFVWIIYASPHPQLSVPRTTRILATFKPSLCVKSLLSGPPGSPTASSEHDKALWQE